MKFSNRDMCMCLCMYTHTYMYLYTHTKLPYIAKREVSYENTTELSTVILIVKILLLFGMT